MKLILLMALSLASSAVFAVPAHTDIGAAVADVDGQLNSVALLLTGAAVLVGVFFVAIGIIKIKSSQEAGGQQKDSSIQLALTSIIIGGLLTTVGSVVFISKDSIFGTNSDAKEGANFTTQDRGHLDKFMSQGKANGN